MLQVTSAFRRGASSAVAIGGELSDTEKSPVPFGVELLQLRPDIAGDIFVH